MSPGAWEPPRGTSQSPGQAASARDWDAVTYDRVSGPQVAWAGRVLDRLPLAGDETALDAGCGSGRVTKLLLERLPRGRVIAVDAAPSMVEQARAALGERATVFQSDLQELTVPEPVDVVFSNAVFHWVPDHDLLFRRLFAALRPGGRLVAQCGGAGNVERFHAVAREVALEDPFAEYLAGWQGPWNFATAEQTSERLVAAGFADVETWLEPSPVQPPEPVEYLRTVCLGHHLEALPQPLRQPYAETVAKRCGTPLELDYVRLNIDARRPT
jgi:trans-aconitate 2-methyltransferase